jgi:2,3-bisphosphoglycerate-independent phosphoglycerate mutase
MTIYDPTFQNVKSILGRERVSDTLSDVLERNSIPQLRIAETEKYAHVTYFFNGLDEAPRKLEDRILVPSLRDVGTYDKAPEMSASAIAENAVDSINRKEYGFVLINFANADMVGHSGNVAATVRGVETVDECLGKIVDAWKRSSRELSVLVTADHGNAEKMFDEITGQPHTAHTSNPVPFCVVSEEWKVAESLDNRGGLSDVAPTILKIMGLDRPKAMTGRPLVEPRLVGAEKEGTETTK